MPRPDHIARIGFVGCGTIAAAMVEGLDAAGQRDPVVVSPRSAGIAAGLAARFPHVSVARHNQDVLDRSSVVVLAVRPQIVDAVLGDLKFRDDHRVVSLVAAVSLAFLQEATAPARSVARAVPLPFVARRQGMTAIYPADADAERMFATLGQTVVTPDEAAFHTFTAATAMMASHFAFAAAIVDWMAGNGALPEQARAFVAAIQRGLASTAIGSPADFATLVHEHATAGGINEQMRTILTERGACDAVTEALDAVRLRLSEAQR